MIKEPSFVRDFTAKEVFWLRVFVCCLFLGRSWEGLFWDLPLRAFFWDQALLEGVVTTLTGDTWQNYVTNKSLPLDSLINFLGVMMGIFWLACGVLVLFVKKEWKWAKWVLYASALSLLILAALFFKDLFMAWGQFWEYATQVTAPLVLVHVIYGGQNTERFRWALKITIAITFFSHGLYAYGYYPQPGVWQQWCMDVFGFATDIAAKKFLVIIGVLDFAAALLILLPLKIAFVPAVWYCIVWGILTAFARIVGNFYSNIPFQSLHEYGYEAFYRLVHGGIPLLLWWATQRFEGDKE